MLCNSAGVTSAGNLLAKASHVAEHRVKGQGRWPPHRMGALQSPMGSGGGYRAEEAVGT